LGILHSRRKWAQGGPFGDGDVPVPAQVETRGDHEYRRESTDDREEAAKRGKETVTSKAERDGECGDKEGHSQAIKDDADDTRGDPMRRKRPEDRSREESDRASDGRNCIDDAVKEHRATRAVELCVALWQAESWLPAEQHPETRNHESQPNDESRVLGMLFNPLGEQPRNDANDHEYCKETA